MKNGEVQEAKHSKAREAFRRFSHGISRVVGSPWSFTIAVLVVFAWACSGPFYQYSDTWQLVINTGTTIVTFLMVFLIQNTQNRDSRAIHLKLDELIRAMKGARNRLVNLEEMSDAELDQLQKQFEKVCGARKSHHEQEVEPRLERNGKAERPVLAESRLGEEGKHSNHSKA